MAKKRKPNGATEVPASVPAQSGNITGLNTVIKQCAKAMLEIKAERQDLNERASDIRLKLKESGVQIKAFEYAVKLFEMDAEAQDEHIDQIRINCAALGIGMQGSLFVDNPDEQDPPEPTEAEEAAAGGP